MRLFVGLGLPENVAFTLELLRGGIHGARWEAQDKLHLTLRYIGEVDGGMVKQIERALASIEADPFSMAIRGVGHFPPRGKPKSVWAGIDDPAPVADLHERIDDELTDLGLEPDRRNFAPHITLARLRDPSSVEVAEFLTRHALLSSPPFRVERFLLYSSIRSPKGSKYVVESAYPLEGRART